MEDNCQIIETLLSEQQLELVLDEMALKIFRLYKTSENLLIFGMASRGIPLAKRLAERLKEKYGQAPFVGAIDASFYRDDFYYRNRIANPKMHISDSLVSVEGKTVILVDDVLYTGRSARAAIQAIFDLGRPSAIRLCCLIDRGSRELPIAPDFTGMKIETRADEEVRVRLTPGDSETIVYLVRVEK